jgi:hypothetical protein
MTYHQLLIFSEGADVVDVVEHSVDVVEAVDVDELVEVTFRRKTNKRSCLMHFT